MVHITFNLKVDYKLTNLLRLVMWTLVWSKWLISIVYFIFAFMLYCRLVDLDSKNQNNDFLWGREECDDSGQLCQVQHDSCWCPGCATGYWGLVSLVHFRVEYLSDIWTHTGALGVEVSLSALTYFWQLFTSHTVQCGHMGVSFNWVGSQVNVFISHRGGIINGFTCVKAYN